MSFGFGFGFPRRLTSGGGLSPSLYLDFVGTNSLPSTVTFSRGTNATLTDSNGRVAYAPHNLLTNSEDFEAAAWSKTAATVTANAAAAPDGSTTADTLTTSGAASPQSVRQTIAQVGQVTFSVYAKAGTAQFLQLLNGSDANCFANFNLSTGVIGTTGTGASSTISDAGSGWYRCTITYTLATSSNWQIYIAPSASATYGQAFGATVANLFIWGAQLNIANAPVNLLTWSEDFTNAAWTPSAATVAANSVVAPDGTTTADTLTSDGLSNQHIVSASPTLAATTTYAFSVYAKAGATNFLQITTNLTAGSANHYANFNLQTGVVSAVGSSATATITSVGNGWYRCVAVMTTVLTSSSATFIVVPVDSGTATRNPTFAAVTSVFIWGAQLNTGSVALPYVATTSSIFLPPAYNSTTPKNLLGFTQEPENAAWTKSNSYVQQNLLTWSDGTVAQLGNSSNVTDAATPISATFVNSIAFGDNSVLRFAYKTFTTVISTVYTLSVFVRMNDDSVPVVGTTATTGDFGLVLESNLQSSPAVVTSIGGGVYRVSTLVTAALGVSSNFGVIKYTTQSAKGFRVTGYQLVQGSTAGDYTQTTSAAAPTRYVNWDGTLTGRKVVDNTATSSHYILQAAAATVAPNVVSVYAKAAERSFVSLAFDGLQAWFNLSTGAVGTVEAGLTGAIQSVGGGWYRCSVARSVTVAGSKSCVIYSATADNVTSYTGDGTSGIYVSDFQLSNSASVDPYVYNPQAAAASTAYYGPRFDYDPVTLAAKGLLIEEQRTNLLTYSEQFDNAVWTKAFSTLSNNAAISPDGTTTAEKSIVDNGIALGASSGAGLRQNYTKAASPITYTQSLFAKAAEFNSIFLFLSNAGASSGAYGVFNLATGTAGATTVFGSGFSGLSTTIENYGNGWYRCILTATSDSTTGLRNSYFPADTVATTGNGTSGVLVWGAQLEAGSFATSYIPTVASQVTRNADSASMLGDNFYTWFNVNQGTISSEFDVAATTAGGGMSVVSIATASTNGYLLYKGLSSALFSAYTDSNNSSIGNLTVNAVAKAAIAYNGVSNAGVLNGATPVAITPVAVTPPTRMYIGSSYSSTPLSGHIRRIGYYNTRLPDSTLQALTT